MKKMSKILSQYRMSSGTVVDSPEVADFLAKKDRFMAECNDAKGQRVQRRTSRRIEVARSAMNAAWDVAVMAKVAKSDTVGRCRVDWVLVQSRWLTA